MNGKDSLFQTPENDLNNNEIKSKIFNQKSFEIEHQKGSINKSYLELNITKKNEDNLKTNDTKDQDETDEVLEIHNEHDPQVKINQNLFIEMKHLFENARFFLIKSFNYENVFLAQTKNVWSTPRANELKLNQAYRECANVILIFTVCGSGDFQGYARLASESRLDPDLQVDWILPPTLNERSLMSIFKIDWITKNDLNYTKTQYLLNSWNENLQVGLERDGQEIEPYCGEALCRTFDLSSSYDTESKIEETNNNLSLIINKAKQRHEEILEESNKNSFNSFLSHNEMYLNGNQILPQLFFPTQMLVPNIYQIIQQNFVAYQNWIASYWHHNSLMLLQNQVEQARKTQIRFNLFTGKVEKEDSLHTDKEYDPIRPNDYEKVVKELKNHRKRSSSRESSRKRTRCSCNRSRKRRRSSSRSQSSSCSSSRSRDRKRRSRRSSSSEDDKQIKLDETRKNMFAPPLSLIEKDLMSLIENPGEIKPVAKIRPSFFKSISKMNEDNRRNYQETGLSKVEKMMAKMGYKKGKGLGRNNQGINLALQVQKTGKYSGRIIHKNDIVSNLTSLSPISKSSVILNDPSITIGIPPEVLKSMSKVILLRNMVGLSEVDPNLEAETREECKNYGEVNSFVVLIIPDRNEDEAVRVFVEFKTIISAISAMMNLNGRFFGGRIIKATFYSLEKFKRKELFDLV